MASNKAKRLFNEMNVNPLIHNVSFFKSINSLKYDIDVAIISTNADIRRKVVENLLEKVDVKYLILEKIAFQSIQDFEIVLELLVKKNTKGWVNCTARLWPFYRKLREEIISEKRIKIGVSGSNWALASNTIHFIDLLAFLTGLNKITIDATALDREIYQSKRQGFIELGGRLIVQSTRGDILDIIDNRKTMIPSLIRIETDNQIIEISQKKILYKSSQKNSDTFTNELPFCKPLQSEISHLMVQEILQTGDSGLTSIDESYILHKPLIEAFNEHLSALNGKPYTVCPVT